MPELLTGVSAAGSVNSWTGVSRRQLLAGFGGLAAAGLPATRWAAAGRAPGALIWQRRAAGTGDLVVTIFAGYGLVYENGNLQDGDDVTYAINEAGGTLAWQIGGAVEPVTAGPGVVYGFGDSGNDVVALRAATGHPLWTRNAAFPLGGPDDSTLLTYASNRLYFASSDMGAWNVTAPSTVGALDARTGRGLWSATLTARTQQPAVTDNAVYASTANGAVALNARTGAQAVLDFENAGLAEPEYDLRIFPGPDMGPGVEMLTATMHHYQALTGRALSAERIMAWHVRQALGDALWRTEAGVPLPDRLNTPIGGTCAPYMGQYMGQQPRDVVAHRQLGGCGWLSSAGSGPVPGGVGSACGPHPTAGAQQAAPGGLPWSRCGWRLVSWCCLVVPRRSGAGHPGQVGGPLGSIVPSGLRRTGVPSPVRRAVQPIWCIRM